MKKKLVAACLVLVMASTVLTGCGNKKSADKASSGSSNGATVEAEDAMAEMPAIKHAKTTYSDGTYYEYTCDEEGRMLTSESKEYDGRVRKIVNEYDEKGNMIGSVTTMDDEPYCTETMTYDENGNQTECVIDYVNEGEYEKDSRYVNSFNSQGMAVLYESYYDGVLSFMDKYEYFADGVTMKSSYNENYDEAGVMTSKVYVEYDEHGNEIRSESTYTDSEMPSINTVTENEYDSNGNLVKSVKRNADSDAVASVCEYEYDDAGHIIRSVNETDDGMFRYKSITEDKYDGDNLLESKYIDVDNEGNETVSYWSVYSYDKAGRQISTVCYRDEKKNISYEYYYNYNSDGSYIYTYKEYDEEGNLYSQEVSTYRDNTPVKTTYEYEGQTTESTYQHDKYGNITKSINNGKVEYTAEFEYWE